MFRLETPAPDQLTLFTAPTARDTMREAVRTCLPESEHRDRWYKHYTDLAYKYATGYTAQGLRRFVMTDIDRSVLDCLTVEELRRVQRAYALITRYLYAGMEYGEIKELLMQERRERHDD